MVRDTALAHATTASEWSYLLSYFFTHHGISPRRVGRPTWCAELVWEVAHKLRYPRFRYLYKAPLLDLGVDEAAARVGSRYEPSNSFALHQCFSSLRRCAGAPDGTAVFVDVGCGAGRVTHEAALRGFRQLVGIDVSEAMCGVCERNLRGHLPPGSVTRRIVNSNIGDVDLAELVGRAAPAVFFLNNPFDRDVLVRFAEKLRPLQALDIYIIYIWKQYPDVLTAHGFQVLYEQTRRGRFTLDSFRIYHRPPCH